VRRRPNTSLLYGRSACPRVDRDQHHVMRSVHARRSGWRRRGCLAVQIEDRGRGMPPGLPAQLQSGGAAGRRRRRHARAVAAAGRPLVERTNASVHLIYDVRNLADRSRRMRVAAERRGVRRHEKRRLRVPAGLWRTHYVWPGAGMSRVSSRATDDPSAAERSGTTRPHRATNCGSSSSGKGPGAD